MASHDTHGPQTPLPGIVLGLLVALIALAQCWDYGSTYPGEDFQIYWSAGRQLTETQDIYSAEGWQDVEQAIALQTGRPGAESSGAVQPLWPKLTGTPFLYAVFRAAATGDYDHDHFWFRLFQLVATGLGIYAWARLFGHGRLAALLAVALFSVAFEPLRSSLRTSNLGQLQVAILALCALVPGRRYGGRGDLVMGCLLGLAVMFKPNLAGCALMLVLVRAVEHRWRPLARLSGGLVLGAGCAAIFTQLVAGPHAVWTHWLSLLGEFVDTPPTFEQGNYALAGMLDRWLGVSTSAALLLIGLSACTLLLGWRARTAPNADPRRSDALALALGGALILLSSPVVWLHYYNLAVPLALFCLRPKTHRRGAAEGPLWWTLVVAAVLSLSLRPILLIGDPGGPPAYALLTVSGAALLWVLAFVAVIRAPGLAGDDEPETAGRCLGRLTDWLHRHGRAAWIIPVLGLALYAGALNGEFHLDDNDRVINNPAIRDVSLIRDLTDPGTSSANPRIVQFRPLMPWTFSLNFAAHGLSTFGYHLVNLAFHLLSSWLVFALACELLTHWSRRRLREQRVRLWSLTAALMFCVHPVSGLVVNYISARDLAMMQGFLLAALLGYVRMRRLGESTRRWVLVLACFGVALLSKTNAAVFPVVVLLFGLVLERQKLWDPRLWLRVAAPSALVAAYVGYSTFVLDFSDVSTAKGPDSPQVYALTQLQVHLTHYFANFVWPWSICAAPGVEAVQTLTGLATWAGLALIVGSLAAAFAWWRSHPLLTFSILCYWVLLAPTSSLLPLHHFAAHYRPYPGSPFLFIGVVTAAGTALSRRSRLPVAAVVIAWFAMASLSQNAVWRTDQSLWRHSVARGGDQLAHFNYAMSLDDRNDPRVKQHLEQAIALYPDYVFAHVNLAILRIDTGDVEGGIGSLQATERRYPSWAEVPYWLGRKLSQLARHGEAAEAFARAAAVDPRRVAYVYAAGRQHQLAGLVAESLPYLDNCERLQPGYEDVRFLRGFALQKAGRTDEAIASYEAQLESDPDHAQTRINLGYALMKLERHAEAIPQFKRALELRPDSRDAAAQLARCEAVVSGATTQGQPGAEPSAVEPLPPGARAQPKTPAESRAQPKAPTAPPAGTMRWHAAPQRDGTADAADAALSDDLARLAEIGYLTAYQAPGETIGVSQYDPGSASRGLNLYLSGHAPAAYLMDMQGDIVHEWRLTYDQAFPAADPALLRLDGTQYFRRAYLCENGDLLLIFDYLGLARIDKQSRLLWAVPGGFHHDLFVTSDRIHVLSERVGVVPEVRPDSRLREDFVTTLNHDGEVLGNVSILRAFLDTPFADALDELPQHDDVLHTNTLQIFDGSQASRSPLLARGNALVCLRNLDLIAILGLQDEAVLWTHKGGWKEQHDPVLLDNGNMLIFDNHIGGDSSRVLEFDPFASSDQGVAWSFEGTPEQTFYSERMGTNQRLPNGNTLIVESFAGRALEVTAEQRIVWQFDNPARSGDDPPLVAILPDLVRIDPGYTSSWLER